MPRPPETEESEAELLAALRRADLRALHELYRRHGGVVHLSAGVVGRRARRDADELTVEAFVSLFHDPPEPGRRALGELLRRVARAAMAPAVGEASATDAARFL
jgi:DNA-directed RNA polymerase specialized sigma24 family protein